MRSCDAVRSSSEAALHDVGVAAADPPVMSFPPNKKEAETRENPWVSASEKLFEFCSLDHKASISGRPILILNFIPPYLRNQKGPRDPIPDRA